MRLLIIFCVLATAAFVAAFFATHDPGVAVNAGGVVAFVYLIILITSTTKSPFPRKLRVWTMVIAFVSIACVGTSWLTQFYQSHWQRSMLLTIHSVISQGWMTDTLTTRSLQTLEAYHSRPKSSKETLADIFYRLNHAPVPNTSPLDTFFNDDKGSVGALTYVGSITDSEVVLFGRDESLRKADSILTVLGIKVKKPLARLRLTPKGIQYEFEN